MYRVSLGNGKHFNFSVNSSIQFDKEMYRDEIYQDYDQNDRKINLHTLFAVSTYEDTEANSDHGWIISKLSTERLPLCTYTIDMDFLYEKTHKLYISSLLGLIKPSKFQRALLHALWKNKIQEIIAILTYQCKLLPTQIYISPYFSMARKEYHSFQKFTEDRQRYLLYWFRTRFFYRFNDKKCPPSKRKELALMNDPTLLASLCKEDLVYIQHALVDGAWISLLNGGNDPAYPIEDVLEDFYESYFDTPLKKILFPKVALSPEELEKHWSIAFDAIQLSANQKPIELNYIQRNIV